MMPPLADFVPLNWIYRMFRQVELRIKGEASTSQKFFPLFLNIDRANIMPTAMRISYPLKRKVFLN
ncbi:hypothetical protein CSA56_06795 [candidate division KSB3 bacterium]|uniref:Uncharacterized protein n=1 Tax=candidate division KSB3 bacterium TaxID=2044937 RepID=A0A2G6KGI8_9BACT|nr:MAG: hypothetical protein CSA56_06795 [candidate division KSB3 bacterium]